MSRCVLLFGGSFNPVHTGHVILLKSIQEVVKAEEILVMPSAVSPHKENIDMPQDFHRLEMCRLAFEDIKNLVVSDYEMKQGGVSFTYLTVEYIKKIYRKSEIYLAMGADMFLSFHTWRKPQEIMKNAVLCTVPRGKSEYTQLLKQEEFLRQLGGKTLIVDKEIPEISSTEIRQAIKNKDNKDSCIPTFTIDSMKGLIPEKVLKYIIIHKLYKG